MVHTALVVFHSFTGPRRRRSISCTLVRLPVSDLRFGVTVDSARRGSPGLVSVIRDSYIVTISEIYPYSGRTSTWNQCTVITV